MGMEHERRFWGVDNILCFDVGGNRIKKNLSGSALTTWAFNFFSQVFTYGLITYFIPYVPIIPVMNAFFWISHFSETSICVYISISSLTS